MASLPACSFDERAPLLPSVVICDYGISPAESTQVDSVEECLDGWHDLPTVDTPIESSRALSSPIQTIQTWIITFSPIDLPTPLPWGPIFAIMLLYSTQTVTSELIMPFVNQTSLENDGIDNVDDDGISSGLSGSALAAINFLSIFALSYLSNRNGRRSVILMGTAGLALLIALFGITSPSIAKLVTPYLTGGLGGVLSACRVMVGELTDKSNQAIAFSALSISSQTGQSVGQYLGEILAHPEQNIPLPIFKHPFWQEHPSLLHCFVASCFALCAVFIGSAALQETLPSESRKATSNADDERSYRDITSTITSGYERGVVRLFRDSVQEAVASARLTALSVLTTHIWSVLLANVLAVLVAECVLAIYPLYAFSPVSSGGLGLSEAFIGTHLALRSMITTSITALYPLLQRRVGTVRMYQLSMALWPVMIFAFPILGMVARSGWIETRPWAMRLMLTILWTAWSGASCIWSSIPIMVNDASPSANTLVILNGLSQMATTIPKSFAPAFAISTFAWSTSLGGLSRNVIWLLLGAIAHLASIQALTLKEPTYDWRTDLIVKLPPLSQ